jgi:hypothetical protein
MIRSLPPLALLVFLSACSLLHDELPNESPTLQISQSICQSPAMTHPDTIVNGSDAFCQVRRGGEIRFLVRAADEDDDPLIYRWNAFGAGSFRDSLASGENSWFAPESITDSSEEFIIQVVISDRDCSTISDPNDRQACIDVAEEIMETFRVEVVQRGPTYSVIADTTVFFREPFIRIDGFGNDPDGDPLEYRWQHTEGQAGLSNITQEALRDDETLEQIGSRAIVIALYPSNYLLRANGEETLFPASYRINTSVNDGERLVEREITVQIPAEPLPEGGMVQLTEPTTGLDFEIDIYEYPNSKGEFPLEATLFEAINFCGVQGKRLCSPSESQAACQGDQPLTYSSTDDPLSYDGLEHFGVRFCNSPKSAFAFLGGGDFTASLAPSGSFPNCGGTTGVFDLTGNIGEWTVVSNHSTGDLEIYFMASDVTIDGGCTFIASAGTLPLAGGDIYDPAVLQQQRESLNEIILQTLEQGSIGFRCCR